MKKRLQQSIKGKIKMKLLFQYPRARSVKVRRGFVLECREEDFDFREDKDGLVTYKYKYLVETKND